VQVEPIKPTLKAPGTVRLSLQYDELLSSFPFKVNLRRYTLASAATMHAQLESAVAARLAAFEQEAARAEAAAANTVGRCRLTPDDPGLTALGFSA
jgi:hypothetical protein